MIHIKRYFFCISLSAMLFSCKEQQKGTAADGPETSISSDTTADLSCAFITEDPKGNIVLSWVKEVNDSTAYVCYAVSNDNGKSFDNPVQIEASKNVHPHGENLPKIIYKPNGEIIAMWGASNPTPVSKYSGLVYYSQSFDEGKTWSSAVSLVTDTSAYDQRYFDMELLPNGEAMVIWLDNRGKKEKEGSTLFCAVTNGKEGFNNEKVIGETVCQCCRTDLFVDRKGNIHASYRDIINDSIRDMVHVVSTDGGRSFSSPVRISEDNWVIRGCPHTGPAQAENDEGLHYAWYTMGGGEGVFYCTSKDLGKTYSSRDTVCSKASAKHPQLISLSNGNVAIVWDEAIKKENVVNGRIGLQLRDAQGKIISTRYISNEDGVAEFPVLKAVDEDQLLIAFNQRIQGKKKVIYRTIKL